MHLFFLCSLDGAALLWGNAFTMPWGDGLLPIRRAVLLGHSHAVEALLSTMETAGKNCPLRFQLAGDLAAAALEVAPDGTSLPAELVRRVVEWEATHFPEHSSLLHRWAAADQAGAFATVQDMPSLRAIVGQMDQLDEVGRTPLDCAIKSNSSNFAKELMDAGCSVRKPYLTEHRSVKMGEVLRMHRPEDPWARTRATLSAGTNLFTSAKRGNLATLEVYELEGADFSQVGADGKTPLDHAIENKRFHVVGLCANIKGGRWKNAG